MKAIGQCFYPGQINARRQRAGTQVVAIDGVLRLTYRDPSLDWLLNVTGPVSVDIEEGACHVLPYDTFVEIEARGPSAVYGLVSVPRPQYPLIAAIGRCAAWIGCHVSANPKDQTGEERRARRETSEQAVDRGFRLKKCRYTGRPHARHLERFTRLPNSSTIPQAAPPS